MTTFELAVVGMSAKQIADLLTEIMEWSTKINMAGGWLPTWLAETADVLRAEWNRRRESLWW